MESHDAEYAGSFGGWIAPVRRTAATDEQQPRTLPYRRRAVEANGAVHAARFAGDTYHFTTACAAYPAPAVDRLEHTPDLPVTCAGCLDATDH
jgi:hypothetical protein